MIFIHGMEKFHQPGKPHAIQCVVVGHNKQVLAVACFCLVLGLAPLHVAAPLKIPVRN